MSGSVIGALRVNLGLDSASFQTGAKRVQKETSSIKSGLLSFAKSVAGPVAAMASLAGVMALVGRGAADIDKVAKSSRRLGTSIGGYRALEMAAGEAGVAIETLADAVQTMDREVAKGSKAAIGALGKLGIAAADLEGLEADQKLALIADRAKELGLSTGQTSAILQELGIRNREMLLAVMAGGDAFRSARTDVDDYGLALSSVQADEIEVANDAIGRLGLVGQYMAQQFALAVTPALGRFAKAVTDSLREGGLLRAVIDLIALAARGVVGAINLAIGSFGVLRTAMDMPERVIRWLFAMGPTALQAQRAIDQLTLAMGSELTQAAALTGELSNGVVMTKDMAQKKLEQARAHLVSADAIRQEQLAMIQNSHAWREFQTTLDSMQGRLEGIIQEQNMFTYDRGEIDDYLAKMQSVRDQQAALLGEAAELSPQYRAVVAEIARIETAIASANGETVTFNGSIITAEDITRRLAGAAGSINFASANSSAAELAKKLGVSLELATRLAGLGLGDVAVAAGDGRGSQRGERQDARAFRRDQWEAQNAERLAKLRNSALGVPSAGVGGGGGGGGGGGRAASEAADAIEKLREEYRNLQATIGMTAREQSVYNAIQLLGKDATQAQKDEVAALIPQIDALKERGETLKKTFEEVRDSVKSAFVGLATGAKSLKSAIGELLSKFAEMLASRAFDMLWQDKGGTSGKGGLGSIVGKIFGFANGTNFAPGGIALVGERGPELVNLPRGSQVKTSQQTKALLGSDGNPLALHVTAAFDESGNAYVKKVARRVAGDVVTQAGPGIAGAAVQQVISMGREDRIF